MTGPAASLFDQIARVAARLPLEILAPLAHQLTTLPAGAALQEGLALAATIRSPAPRRLVRDLIHAACSSPDPVSLSQLGWALRGAAAADALHRARVNTELVWTGPSALATSFRRTEQALLEVIHAAREQLLIATFAAYRIPLVAEALREATARGVAIQFVLESPETSAGGAAFMAIRTMMAGLAPPPACFIWPLEQRERDPSDQPGSFHVKCAVADEHTLFISSANLTGHALDLNMELGVLVRGGDLPGQLARHFRRLIQDAELVEIEG